MNGIEQIRKQNQRTIVLLFLAFIIPVAAAYLVYLNMDHAGKTKNHGELIIPPRPLDSMKLTTLDARPFGGEQLRGNWHLVYISNGACEQLCRDRLSIMHQARVAQGKAMSRVGLLYIAMDKSAAAGLDGLTKDYSHLTVLAGEQLNINEAIKLFQTDNVYNIREDNLIYMVDPLGNLMMRYKKDVRLIGIIKDLEHLLKISQIG